MTSNKYSVAQQMEILLGRTAFAQSLRHAAQKLRESVTLCTNSAHDRDEPPADPLYVLKDLEQVIDKEDAKQPGIHGRLEESHCGRAQNEHIEHHVANECCEVVEFSVGEKMFPARIVADPKPVEKFAQVEANEEAD